MLKIDSKYFVYVDDFLTQTFTLLLFMICTLAKSRQYYFIIYVGHIYDQEKLQNSLGNTDPLKSHLYKKIRY